MREITQIGGSWGGRDLHFCDTTADVNGDELRAPALIART